MKAYKTIFAAAAALLLATAEAGFTRTVDITNNSRRRLSDNCIYRVVKDMTVSVSAGLSAFYVESGATAVIYIPEGKTLTLKGGAASGTTGAGAGIDVPYGSTLVIVGGGKLVAEGGKASNGTNGDNGSGATLDNDDTQGAWGGAGGSGGGGAGAGIGTGGGNGGRGGSRPSEPIKVPTSRWDSDMTDHEDENGNGGNSGASGAMSGACGNIYILGSVTVEAKGGGAGSGGGGGYAGSGKWDYWTWEYHAASSGGGGGGAGGGAASSIGSGGGGGGGGGSGGNGHFFWCARGGNPTGPDGGGGGGGRGDSSNNGGGGYGTVGWYKSQTRGGYGGSGGSSGGQGSNGSLYADSTATLSAQGRSASSATAHSAISYNLKFNDSWRFTTNITARFGYPLPAGFRTSRYGYRFKGWYTQTNGMGEKYYDANGYAVKLRWDSFGDVTLYPFWEPKGDSEEDPGKAKLWINNTLIDGESSDYGDGWTYSVSTGVITLSKNRQYEIHGVVPDGFAQIVADTDCEILVRTNLVMTVGEREDYKYTPIKVASGKCVTLDVHRLNDFRPVCSLTASDYNPAIRVPGDGTLVLKTSGILNVEGGVGAADIGCGRDDASAGTIYVETYSNWIANIRPAHGLDDNNGFCNESGVGATFRSYATSNIVTSVLVDSLVFAEEDGGEMDFHLQRIEGKDPVDTVQPNEDYCAWMWIEPGGYEWAQVPNADIASNNLWVAYTEGWHCRAAFFMPLHVEVDGDDIAHLTGKGWYTTRPADTNMGDRATLVITNSETHVVTGYGNAGIELQCNASLVISNLFLNTAAWAGKTPILPAAGVTFDLGLEGTNRLIASEGRAAVAVPPSCTANIDGGGYLYAQGGRNAAAIGGSAVSDAEKSCGTIRIKGGEYKAVGGTNAAGIGGANSGSDGTVYITGGVITAKGGQYGAAIGGGSTGSVKVEITGGTVFPTAGAYASAIGAGRNATVTNSVVFGVAAVYTTTNLVHRAPVSATNSKRVFPVNFPFEEPDALVSNITVKVAGSLKNLDCVDLRTDGEGNLKLWFEATNGEKIPISIAVVTRDGHVVIKTWGLVIDENGEEQVTNDVLTIDGYPITAGVDDSGDGWNYTTSTGNLVISSGDHTLSGLCTNGAIRVIATGGGINLTLDDLTLMTPNSELSPFVVSNSCTFTIRSENTIGCYVNPNATSKKQFGSQNTAGVEVPEGASLTIGGTGRLTAISGFGGAGIGSRGLNLNAGSITVKGGIVFAVASYSEKLVNGGAGIGGGHGGLFESIRIEGGYVFARGSRQSPGIGCGMSCKSTPAADAFHVTGGSVLAERGPHCTNDFTTPGGGVVPLKPEGEVVIDGGSVRPRNAIATTSNPNPWPVNSDGEELRFVILSGLGAGNYVTVTDGLWENYNGTELLTDEDGCVCLWGVKTNTMHSISIEGVNIMGGSTSTNISAQVNTTNAVLDISSEAPEKRTINGVDCWRVSVYALPAAKKLPVVGIDAKYNRGVTFSDPTGLSYIYLPDGEYEFTVGGYTYCATVAGGPAVATFTVGITVDGVDIGARYGDGWEFDGTSEVLRLLNATTYEIAGTNSERKVSIVSYNKGVKLRADRLKLREAAKGALALAGGEVDADLEFLGGTIWAESNQYPLTVSGGALNMDLSDPVAPDGSVAHRVTVTGFDSYARVTVVALDGLGAYDFDGIYANEYGEFYLHLPDGNYLFKASDANLSRTLVAVVEGGDTYALDYIPTGVTINGTEAARLVGAGWRNELGLVTLNAATNYVISGENSGAAITFNALIGRQSVTFDNLILENSEMVATPFVFGGNSIEKTFSLELVGSNVLYAAVENTCGLEIAMRSTLTIGGSGTLVATGNGTGAGIGVRDGVAGGSLVVKSGVIRATGGESGPGIGGALGGVAIDGGIVKAVGGEGAAGIGGAPGGAAISYAQSAGTVVATGRNTNDIGVGSLGGVAEATTKITGGSLHLAGTGTCGVAPVNATNAPVYRVTVTTPYANFNVGAVRSAFGDYSLKDVWTDARGKVYVYLPDGTYYMNIGNIPYRVTVAGGPAEAEQWAQGIEVDGVDIAIGEGKGWVFDLYGRNLYVGGDCTISGPEPESFVSVAITNTSFVVVSNLVLTAGEAEPHAPLAILNSAAVHLSIAGTNVFDASRGYMPGVYVPASSKLYIDKIDSIVQIPDLDSIHETTNVVEVVDEVDNGDGTYGVVTNMVEIVTVVTNFYDKIVTPKLTAKGGVASGSYGSAGIGGAFGVGAYGSISISGGIVEATGGYGAAGIGGGTQESRRADSSRDGAISIGGGDITAQGGVYGAGIGGGNYNSGGTITIFDGNIVAAGGKGAAGIGGGECSRALEINIYGGDVAAKADRYGAGIGCGSFYAVVPDYAESVETAITISGGQILAEGGLGAAGIGAGAYDLRIPATTVTGGTIVAKSGGVYRLPYPYSTAPAGVGNGALHLGSIGDLDPRRLLIKGASLHALPDVRPAASNDTERVYCVEVETAATNKIVSVEYLSGYKFSTDIRSDDEGKVYLWLPSGEYVFYVGNEPRSVVVGDKDASAVEWKCGVTVDGVDVATTSDGDDSWCYDYSRRELLFSDSASGREKVVSGTNSSDRVHIVVDTVLAVDLVISNLCLKTSSAAPLRAQNGALTVALAATNDLLSTAEDYAGLEVRYGASLVVTNLEENATLNAVGSGRGAGIGGTGSYSLGNIEIAGGIVNAKGGYEGGTGIGQASVGTQEAVSPAMIRISGGRVNAVGADCPDDRYGSGGAGIGAGRYSNATGLSVEISGGTVVATAGEGYPDTASDIGAVNYSSLASFVITGGSIVTNRNGFAADSVSNIVEPHGAGGESLRAVVVSWPANTKFDCVCEGYGTKDLYADTQGRVVLWLARGTYVFHMADRSIRTCVVGDGSIGWGDSHEPYDVFVDGVDILAGSGGGWTFVPDSGELTVQSGHVVSGSNEVDNVCVVVTGSANVVLSNLYVKATAVAPVAIRGVGTLTLEGVNTLLGGDTAGVYVDTNAVLTITGDGTLFATGGPQCAGIGSNYQGGRATVNIESGVVHATGGDYGNGIGGGYWGHGFSVNISGGRVFATAGVNGNGIGGGSGGSRIGPARNSSIAISGGTVKAVSGGAHDNAAIGSLNAKEDFVSFSGGSIDADKIHATSAITNSSGVAVFKNEISGLEPDAKVLFEGLPDWFGASGIYADSDGKVFLWLPENWTSTNNVSPISVTASIQGAAGWSGSKIVTASTRELADASVELSLSPEAEAAGQKLSYYKKTVVDNGDGTWTVSVGFADDVQNDVEEGSTDVTTETASLSVGNTKKGLWYGLETSFNNGTFVDGDNFIQATEDGQVINFTLDHADLLTAETPTVFIRIKVADSNPAAH